MIVERMEVLQFIRKWVGVQWAAKVMTPGSMDFLWEQVHDFWDPLYLRGWLYGEADKMENFCKSEHFTNQSNTLYNIKKTCQKYGKV